MAYALKYNPFIDDMQYVTKNDFLPWSSIPAGVTVTVSEGREMIVTEELVVGGELVVLGQITVLSQTIDDSAGLNTYVGENIQDILDRLFGATESTAISYNVDGSIDYVEGFSVATQVVANRIYRADFTYDAQLYPTAEEYKIYSLTDGTTILKTVTVTYTWSSGNLISTTQVTA